MAWAFSKCSVGFKLCNALVLDLCGGVDLYVHTVFGEWHWKDSLTPIVLLQGSNRVGSYWVNPVMWWIDEILKHFNFPFSRLPTTLVGGESIRHSILVLEANHLVHVQQQTKALRVQLPSAWMNERIKLSKRCNSCCCCCCCCCSWFESNLHPSLCVGALSLSLTEWFF